MKNKIKANCFLFKNFNNNLPKVFIEDLRKEYPEFIVENVYGGFDLNRYDQTLRTNAVLIKYIMNWNAQHNNMLSSFLKFVTVKSSLFTNKLPVFYIELNANNEEQLIY